MRDPKPLGEFIAELQAIADEHGPEIEVYIGGGRDDGIEVKASNKGTRARPDPVWQAVIDFASW